MRQRRKAKREKKKRQKNRLERKPTSKMVERRTHRQTEIKQQKGRDDDKCSSRKGKEVSVNQRIGCIQKDFEELRRERGREREKKKKLQTEIKDEEK